MHAAFVMMKLVGMAKIIFKTCANLIPHTVVSVPQLKVLAEMPQVSIALFVNHKIISC